MSDEQLTTFANDLAKFLTPYIREGYDPLLLAGTMMSCTIELYTGALENNEDIYRLLEVVAESVEGIRNKNTPHMSKLVH